MEEVLGADELDIAYNDHHFIEEPFSETPIIENEIFKLKELYNDGFIPRHEYALRYQMLNAMKKKSVVNTVPHTDYSFISPVGTSNLKRDRNVRVFLSSTFRDMGAEREMILKRVFPRLQAFCKERGIVITPVDLRWGITSEQTNQGNTISYILLISLIC